MLRASESIDLNPWSVQSQLGHHPSIGGQAIIHGASIGPSSRELSRDAAQRSALIQALKGRSAARTATSSKGHLSLLARLRQIVPTKSAA